MPSDSFWLFLCILYRFFSRVSASGEGVCEPHRIRLGGFYEVVLSAAKDLMLLLEGPYPRYFGDESASG